MEVLLALALAAAALIVAGAVAVYLCRAGRRLEASLESMRAGLCSLEGRHCVVNTKRPDDQSIRGVVSEQYDDGGLLLRAAAYLEPGGQELDAGDVYLPGSSVSSVQVDAPLPAPPAESGAHGDGRDRVRRV